MWMQSYNIKKYPVSCLRFYRNMIELAKHTSKMQWDGQEKEAISMSDTVPKAYTPELLHVDPITKRTNITL